MGLDTTHGCWHGAYSAFGRWRDELARVAGIPLQLMEGFYSTDPSSFRGAPSSQALEWIAPREGGPLCQSHYGPELHYWAQRIIKWIPISWDALKPDVLHVLLNHSDCDGEIEADHCAPLADRLEELLPLLPVTPDPGHIGDWRIKTQTFIDGLRLAASRNEPVGFH